MDMMQYFGVSESRWSDEQRKVRGGRPVLNSMIPLSKPSIGEEEIQAVVRVLRSDWLVQGPECAKFERAFAEYIGCEYAISVNSCTAALFLVLKAFDITGEVILPSFTFVASANAIVTAGATPVFVDVDYHTCNLDPFAVEKAITAQTRAILPVHFAGQSCQMDQIVEIADRHNLIVIEDSAEAIGATFKRKKTGSFGVGCFSFFPTKNITTGEGGMITTDDRVLVREVRLLAAHGVIRDSSSPWNRIAVLPGYNFRMTDFQAAMGIEQLKKLEDMNAARRSIAAFYNEHLPDDLFDLPIQAPDCHHVYQMYTLKAKDGIDRDSLVRKLRERGIGASVHFDPPVHRQSYYISRGWGNNRLPVTEEVSRNTLTLPLYPDMTEPQAGRVVSIIEEILI